MAERGEVQTVSINGGERACDTLDIGKNRRAWVLQDIVTQKINTWYLTNPRLNFKSGDSLFKLSNTQGFDFSKDGSICAIADRADRGLYDFDLDQTWDFAHVIHNNFNRLTDLTRPIDVAYAKDGERIYAVDDSDTEIVEFHTSTDYRVGNVSKTGTLDNNTSNIASVAVSTDGTYLYEGGDSVIQYEMGTSWDIDTASKIRTRTFDSLGRKKGIEWNYHDSDKPGTQLFLCDGGQTIYEYHVGDAWNIDSAELVKEFTVRTDTTRTVDDVVLQPDENELFEIDKNARVYQYTNREKKWEQIPQAPFENPATDHPSTASTDNSTEMGVATGDVLGTGTSNDIIAFDPANDSWHFKDSSTKQWSASYGRLGEGAVWNLCGLGANSVSQHKQIDVSDSGISVDTSVANFAGASRHRLVATDWEGKGFAGTGIDDSGNWYTDFYTYDVSQDSWSSETDIPEARKNARAINLGGDVYVCMGQTQSGYTTKMTKYDGTGWTQMASFPGSDGGRQHFGLVKKEGKAYLVAGKSSNGIKGDVWEYDPSGDSWSEMTPDFIGGPIGSMGKGFTINGERYVGGGMEETDEFPASFDWWRMKKHDRV